MGYDLNGKIICDICNSRKSNSEIRKGGVTDETLRIYKVISIGTNNNKN